MERCRLRWLRTQNTVAWAAGDTVEEPHYYKQQTYADTELVTQYMRRPTQFVSAGKTYGGLMGVGARGWQITNATPVSSYFGAGGSYNVPDDAYVASGPWDNDFELDAGVNAVMRVHCNLTTCGRWDSAYKLFDLDAASGEDFLFYSPQSSTMTWQLSGQTYTLSPQSLTAGTIDVGTLNATTINGAVTAVRATSGTMDGVTVGANTPATGSFTSVTATTYNNLPAQRMAWVGATNYQFSGGSNSFIYYTPSQGITITGIDIGLQNPGVCAGEPVLTIFDAALGIIYSYTLKTANPQVNTGLNVQVQAGHTITVYTSSASCSTNPAGNVTVEYKMTGTL